MGPRYRVLAPALVGLAALGAWEGVVRWQGIPPYILPGPVLIARTVVTDWGTLFPSLLVTLAITAAAFVVSAVLGLVLAVLFTQSAWIERAFFPYAVILQVTPLVAIAPLIILWVKWIPLALLVCAWLVAFFPVLSNAVLGLTSTDRNLVDLFRLYGATRWQALRYLRLPAALPYFLGGLRISGGLALIGAVVAQGIRAGAFRRVDVLRAAAVILALVDGVSLQLTFDPAAFRVADATRFCGDAVMRYLAREAS